MTTAEMEKETFRSASILTSGIDTNGTVGATKKTGTRIKASSPIYGDILDFLIDESALLDDDRHLEWLDSLTDDIIYKMPTRRTLYRRDGNGLDERYNYFYEDRKSLALRAQRVSGLPSAHDRDPAPRIRRMVTNLVVHEASTADEYAATTNLVLLRNKLDDPNYDVLSARREDIIRRNCDGVCKLARRLILVDQATLGAVYINVFI